MNNVSQALANFFKSHKITQEQIASRLGCSQAYVSGILSAKKELGRRSAAKWAETFGFNQAWLLTGEGTMFGNQTMDAIVWLKEQGYVVLAVEQCEGSTPLQDFHREAGRKYAVVLGNEVKGVQQEVVDHCDGCLEIPQYGTKHSLNVSVAAGIVLWHLTK